jgi:hypothetical protein
VHPAWSVGFERARTQASIDARHALNHLLVESAANRADADNRRRFNALDCGNEIPRGRMVVSIRLLEVEQVREGVLKQAID